MKMRSNSNRQISWPVGLLSILIMAALLFIIVSSAEAQDPSQSVTDDEVNAIAKDLFCPICESTPLDVCETQACADWRDVIREKLAEGQSEEQIKEYFGALYGVRALAEPPAKGITLPVWLVPLIAIPAAIAGFVLYLRSLRQPAQMAAASGERVSMEKDEPHEDQDPYIARIEEELRDM